MKISVRGSSSDVHSLCLILKKIIHDEKEPFKKRI